MEIWNFFTAHQAAVVEAACSRLIPGPFDDTTESGHPGAREARVVVYIDNLLGCFSQDPPMVYANHRAAQHRKVEYLALTVPKQIGWNQRIRWLQEMYQSGITELDLRSTKGDYLAIDAEERDAIFLQPEMEPFRNMLFDHAIEGMYSHPIYRNNQGSRIWDDLCIAEPDSYNGYQAFEVSGARYSAVLQDKASDELVCRNFELLIQWLVGADGFHG